MLWYKVIGRCLLKQFVGRFLIFGSRFSHGHRLRLGGSPIVILKTALGTRDRSESLVALLAVQVHLVMVLLPELAMQLSVRRHPHRLGLQSAPARDLLLRLHLVSFETGR